MVDRLTGHSLPAKVQFGGINPSGRVASPQDVGAAQVITPMAPGRTLTVASHKSQVTLPANRMHP